MIEGIKKFIQNLIRFITYDIWRVSKDDSSARRINLYNIIKSFILAIRKIDGSQLNVRASALTYSSLLSLVPMLAVLFAIGRGFGLQNIIESQLFSYFEGQKDILNEAITFIDNSLQYAQGGVFLGIGIVLLIYTVVNLLSNIESNFNRIWGIKKSRTYYRMFTDYLALIIVAPVFLICNAGLTVFLSYAAETEIIGLVITPFLKFVPYIITILLFTFFYIYIPNTHVKFLSALLGGIFTGIVFQIFQMLYISGQVWISKYNAIYGSFAALPLLLLWLQLTWFIVLFGVELTYAHQNIKKFSFEKEVNNISRRYRDFILLAITTLIVKRFETGETPYTSDEISETYSIPTQLVNDSIYKLMEAGVLCETPIEDDKETGYIPAIDINQITVSYLLDKIDQFGSEDFIVDITNEFKEEWTKTLKIREVISSGEGQTLLKNL